MWVWWNEVSTLRDVLLQDALELRIYLHDRSLMEYADKMEQAGKNLPELLITSPAELTSMFGMRKADVSRFTDRSLACGIKMPPTHALMKKARTRVVVAPATQKLVPAAADHTTPKADHDHNNNKTTAVVDAKVLDGCDADADQLSPAKLADSDLLRNEMYAQTGPLTTEGGGLAEGGDSQGFQPPSVLRPIGSKSTKAASQGGTHSKAIYRAAPSPQLCGFGMSDHAVVEDVTQLSVLENIILQKLTPVHKAGRDTDMAQLIKKRPPPFKASELWATKPTLVFCLRRPG